MDTKISELVAARAELQAHLANVVKGLWAARTAQAIQAATHGVDGELAATIEHMAVQERALRGILAMVCDRLEQLEPAASMH